MPRHAAQATRPRHKKFVVVVALVCGLVTGVRARADEAASRRELLKACDELRHEAVTSAYGWAWAADSTAAAAGADPAASPTASPKKSRARGAPAPEIDTRATASAGLVLHLLGQSLHSEPERHAAREAARGLAAVQLQTGQMPAGARLLPRPGGYAESVGIVPDRAPTCAALALMLLVIEADKDKADNRVVAGATRAATWLARQPTSAGGWQSAYPPGAGLKARRLIRLDDRSYRDSTFAMLLASSVLERREYALTADRCVDELLRVRIHADGATGQWLWPPAAKLGGEVADDIPELPPGVDLVATRYAMETLLAARIVTNHDGLDKELASAVTSITALPKPGGRWLRRYDVFASSAPAEAPTTKPSDTSDDGNKSNETKAKTRPSPNVLQGEDFAQTLRAVHLTQTAGPKTWTEPKPGEPRLAERLAVTACGLTDRPFGALADGGPNPNLDERVREVWTLYAGSTAGSAAKPSR
jgi:hypothetical protein